MEILCIVLTVITSILLIIVVLIQKSKGGGLSSSFAGSNQIMGVRRTNNFIEKATWTLACIILVLSIASVFFMKDNVVTASHVTPPTQQVVKGSETTAPVAPAAPVAAEEAAAPVAPAEAPAAPAAPAE